MRMAIKYKTVKALVALIFGIIVIAFGILRSDRYLVVNHPERSDVIVVLAGDHDDRRYWRAISLLREGYGRRMIVDASTDRIYGRTYAEHAADFIAASAGQNKSQISICAITNDSTVQEAADVRSCLTELQPTPRSVLLVTSDFHTRRALSILSTRLSQYHWSVAAVNDPAVFGRPWWHNREWAKTFAYEWEKLLWWRLFESWR